MLLLSVGLGASIGLLLGLMGGGGSILTVPALVYLLGQDVHTAAPTSLVIVGVSALVATIGHARARHVSLKAGLLFGGLGGSTALLGAWLNKRVASEAVLFLFALMMVAAALTLLLRQPPSYRGGVDPAALCNRAVCNRVALAGAGVGLLTGFFGVGGGFITVPALTLLAGMPMHIAVGTSLLAVALQSGWGLLGYLSFGRVDWVLAAAFLAGSLLGSLLGARLSGRISGPVLARSFAVLLFLIAGYLLYRNLGYVLRG